MMESKQELEERFKKQRLETVTTLFSYSTLPLGVEYEIVQFQAEDKAVSWGVLYTKGKPKTVVVIMHQRTDNSRHFTIPYLVEAGFAAFGQNNRYTGNDVDAIHENMLLDIAAGIRFLRERGFERVILLGASGGGALFSFYQSQASTAPPHRVACTPAGDPPDLNQYDLPPADGLVHLGAHLGQGKFLMMNIDPSVVDENDPLSCDPTLDMYNPANGFRFPPEETRYSPEFLARYREAQRARVARIDAIARDHIEQQRFFKQLMEDSSFRYLRPEQQLQIRRRAILGKYLVIHRTMANPTCVDLSLNPSDRVRGTLRSSEPEVYNFTEYGYARILTPRAWLSSWSGHASHASTVDCSRKVTVPVLMVYGTADVEVLPSDGQLIYEATASEDKQFILIEGAGHWFTPEGPKAGRKDQREQTMRTIINWLRERFPC
jgi:pimeloyl-ACP methyl ester carboxylesterase